MRLTLASGRVAGMDQIIQWRTYAGLLAGLPDTTINQGHIDRLLEAGRRLHIDGAEPVLVFPKVRTIPHTRNGVAVNELRLPAVACVARFESGALRRPDSEPYSTLVVAWFQDSFALPIDPEIERQVCLIDWERDAKDWCW